MVHSNSRARQFDLESPETCIPAAVIYTHSMLEGSMTFIKSHAEALTKFIPVYAGSHRVPGIALPRERTFVFNNGTPVGLLREAAFRKLGCTAGVAKHLRAHNPKVVHAHFGDCGPSGLVLAERLEVPLVVTFHGQDATRSLQESMKTHRGRELLRNKESLIERAGVFIAVSDYIQQRLLEQGYPEEKIEVHRNGIDLDFFEPDMQQSREPIILFIGRFVEKKGVRYLIEAAEILHTKGIKFEVVMIGGGPLEDEIRNAVSRAGFTCRFEGFLDANAVKKWLARASVVAVPSVVAENGDSEGLPTVLLEAQAMGAPVVATYHSGIPEGVIDGTTAELTGERDSATLAHKIESFLLSPDKVRAFGVAGRQFVSDNFNIKTQVMGLEEIYNDVYQRYTATTAR